MKKGIWVLVAVFFLMATWQMVSARPYVPAATTCLKFLKADSLAASGDTLRVDVDIDELLDLANPHRMDTTFLGSDKVKAFIRKYESLKGQPALEWSHEGIVATYPDSGFLMFPNISAYPISLDSVLVIDNKYGIADTLDLKIQRRKYHGSEPDSVFYIANTGWDSVGVYLNTVESALSDTIAADEVLWIEAPAGGDSLHQRTVKFYYHLVQ